MHDQITRRLVGASLTERADEQRQPPPGEMRTPAGAKHAVEQLDRLLAALELIDVRVGVEADDGIRAGEHTGARVRVQVKRDDDQNVAHELAHRADQVGFGVLGILGDHGAVQGQDEPVEWHGLLDPGEHRLPDRSSRGRRHDRSRHRRRGQQRHGRLPKAATRVQSTADLGPRALVQVAEGAASIGELEGVKLVELGEPTRERIGLVPDAADTDSPRRLGHDSSAHWRSTAASPNSWRPIDAVIAPSTRRVAPLM